MMIFEYLFAKNLYTDHQTLVDIAKGQNANVVYTRESDAELVENSHRLVVWGAFILFYGFIILSVVYGSVYSDPITGAACLLASGLLPILTLRVYEMAKGDDNRDEKIASQVEDAIEDGGRVVAVMGKKHAENVPKYLPEEMNPEERGPKYRTFSLSMLKDLTFPIIRVCGTLAIVYPIFLTVAEFYLSFL